MRRSKTWIWILSPSYNWKHPVPISLFLFLLYSTRALPTLQIALLKSLFAILHQIVGLWKHSDSNWKIWRFDISNILLAEQFLELNGSSQHHSENQKEREGNAHSHGVSSFLNFVSEKSYINSLYLYCEVCCKNFISLLKCFLKIQSCNGWNSKYTMNCTEVFSFCFFLIPIFSLFLFCLLTILVLVFMQWIGQFWENYDCFED